MAVRQVTQKFEVAMMKRYRPEIFTALIALAALTGCQDEPPAVAQEQAKKSATQFEAPSFVPPPRTVTDIFEIFKEADHRLPAEIEKQRKTAALLKPRRTDAESLALFYRDRHRARRDLGQVVGALSDARKALEYYQQSQDYQQRRIGSVLNDLGNAELTFGNFRNSIELFKQSLAERKSIVRYAQLVSAYARSGDIDGAVKLKAEADLHAARLLGLPNLSTRRAINVEISQARMAQAIHRWSGRFEEAEKDLRQIIALYRKIPEAPTIRLINSTNTLAQIFRGQGRFLESEVAQREAVVLSLRTYGKNHPATASMVRNLAVLLSAQGRFADSGRLLDEVMKINKQLQIPPDSWLFGVALLQRANNLTLRQEWLEAVRTFDDLRNNMVSNRALADRWFANNVFYPLALIKSGHPGEAESLLRAMMDRDLMKARGQRSRTMEKRALLGMALLAQGRLAEAYFSLHDAIHRLTARADNTDDEDGVVSAREWRLQHYLESYIELMYRLHEAPTTVQLDEPPAEEAFRFAEIARSSAVQRAISAAAGRNAPGNAALGNLIREEQNLGKQEEALLGLLVNVASSPTDQQDPKVVQALQAKIDALRARQRGLSKTIEAQFPDYANLVSSVPVSTAAVAATLRGREALIATYTTETKTYLWVLRHSGKLAFAAVPVGATQLSAAVDALRRSLSPAAATLGDIPAFDVATAYRLYRSILVPVADSWKEAEQLLTVMHGPLGQLPLSLLVTAPVSRDSASGALFSNYRDVPWLLRSHAVTTLPSVASLSALRTLPRGNETRRSFAGFADPWFSPAQASAAETSAKPVQAAALASRDTLTTRGLPIKLRSTPKVESLSSATIGRLPRLPETAGEIRSIAAAMRADISRDVFTGREASEGRVKSMDLAGYRVITFATHGLVPGDLDGLTQPALALSSPSVTGGRDDGLLTMGEIMGLKLDADWVVLSACNTASGNGAGAEAVSGLGRAFFYAGTRALLVSNWPVETNSARLLTTDLFARQAADATLTRAEALRRAELALIDGPGFRDPQGRTVFSYAHPIFWAPFSLIGDGGGGKPAG